MSILGAKDNETRSYLEIVDALRQHGAAPQQDMDELWRRMVFNILISNTDDQLIPDKLLGSAIGFFPLRAFQID